MQDDAHSDYELEPASVLVVDDSRLSALKLAKAMRALGHRAETASGGAEALQRLREETFDVVLLDIVMPGMDGYEVLDVLKSDASFRELPVIVISSLDDEIESVTKAIELGAEDFLPKEFEPAILRARVNASLARKRFRDRLAAKSSQLEQLSRQLAKYLSPQVYESIFQGRQEVKITASRKKLTVFFSDIAGFTETTERLESEELTQILNHYLTAMSRIALAHGATIDKFVGDAILIFFGDPETRGVREDARACVRMAMAMRRRMTELAAEWRAAGIAHPLRCRMGIHTDFCTVGNFGSDDRLDYTIIGRGVNVASRLESKAVPGEILLSFETHAHVAGEIACEEQGEVMVKGVARPLATYRVLEDDEAVDDEDMDGSALAALIGDDPGAMSEAERQRAMIRLSRALDRLREASRKARMIE